MKKKIALSIFLPLIASISFSQNKIKYFQTDFLQWSHVCPNIHYTALIKKDKNAYWQGFSIGVGYQIRLGKELSSLRFNKKYPSTSEQHLNFHWEVNGLVTRLEYMHQVKKRNLERMLYVVGGVQLKYLWANNAFEKRGTQTNYFNQQIFGTEPYLLFGIKGIKRGKMIDFTVGPLCAFRFRDRKYLSQQFPLSRLYEANTVYPGVMLQFKVGILSKAFKERSFQNNEFK